MDVVKLMKSVVTGQRGTVGTSQKQPTVNLPARTFRDVLACAGLWLLS